MESKKQKLSPTDIKIIKYESMAFSLFQRTLKKAKRH